MKQIIIFLALVLCSTYLQSLHILVVTDVFPTPTRPFILNQITGLIDHGHTVHIYAKKQCMKALPPEINRYNLLQQTSYQKLEVAVQQFDIIFCQFGFLANEFLWVKDQYPNGPKLVVAFRGYDASAALHRNPSLYKKLYKKGDLFLPVCNYFAQSLITNGCPPEKIIVHHSAIDTTMFAYQEHTWPEHNIVKLITVGRLVKEKGHACVIKALAQLYKKHKNIRYLIIGDGPEKQNLILLARKLGIAHLVTFTGLLPHHTIADKLAQSHVFVLTPFTQPIKIKGKVNPIGGIKEGIPNSLMEAMACGLPVIGTDHAGIPELIENGVSGLLIPENNVNALATELTYLLNHPEQWTTLGQAGRKCVVSGHNYTIQTNHLVTLFEDLCA